MKAAAAYLARLGRTDAPCRFKVTILLVMGAEKALHRLERFG